jgi:putative flippase GtrA
MKAKKVGKHTLGMFVIGGIVWILYLVYANVLTIQLGLNHFIAECTGIPISWVINYWLNTKFNFDLSFTWKRFGSFCGISAIGWAVYLGTTFVMSDVLGIFTFWGTIVGVFTKTLFNVALQQIITFGKLAKVGNND